MSNDARDRAQARFKTAADDARSGKTDRELAAKAVLDNMARLKALRLAKEALQPPPATPIRKAPATRGRKTGDSAPALSDWLASQQNGGRRT